jgi:hypothetical protein
MRIIESGEIPKKRQTPVIGKDRKQAADMRDCLRRLAAETVGKTPCFCGRK